MSLIAWACPDATLKVHVAEARLDEPEIGLDNVLDLD
jgi:hypothetical protein